jgi:hypothetical protein
VILGSVYLAVYLEGASERSSERADARVALVQLRGELAEDLEDFDRIIAWQQHLNEGYLDLIRWLTGPGPLPTDSVGATIFEVSSENSTLFPRRATWTTMVAGGQLAQLEDPELVQLLGQLYETQYPRIDYNSRFYDEGLGRLFQDEPVISWTTLYTDPIQGSAREIAHFASQLEWLRSTWTVWYIDTLSQFREDVEQAVQAIDGHLDANS